MKDKEHYIAVFNKKWDECLERATAEHKENQPCNVDIECIADEIFADTANAEEITGYYIVYHKNHALKDWIDNTKGIQFTAKDKEVDKILKKLYGK